MPRKPEATRRKNLQYSAALAAIAAILWATSSLKHSPILLHSLGDRDCACGSIYIKTTMRCLWNPFRDRRPEIVADQFLSNLRANTCPVKDELCQKMLPSHRVSAWKLTYREDQADTVSLYYKLGKYPNPHPDDASVAPSKCATFHQKPKFIGFDAIF